MKTSVLWIDQITESMQKLRISYWLSCNLIGLIIILPAVLLSIPLDKIKENVPLFLFFVFFLVFLFSYPLFILGKLPFWVRKYMEKFRLVLKETEETYQSIVSNMISQDIKSKYLKVANFILLILFVVFFVIASIKNGLVNAYGNLVFLIFLLLAMLVVTKIVYLLFEINKLKSLNIEINILNLLPVRALANLVQKIAVYIIPMAIAFSLVGIISIDMYTNSKNNLSWVVYAQLGVLGPLLVILSICIFIFPTLWIRQLIIERKEKTLSDLSKKLDDLFQIYDELIETHKLSEIEKVWGAINGLVERVELNKKVSDWPWEERTLREFFIVIIIPIILSIVQLYLTKIMQ